MNPSSSALARSHEDTLLPLTRQLAAELLRAVPLSAKVEAIIFRAEFPEPGQVVKAGVILHELDGERRAIPLHLTSEGHKLVTACSLYESGTRLTSIEIKIAANGQCTPSFGASWKPRSDEELKAYFDRLYGNIPEAPAPTLKPAGCLGMWLRPFFGPKLKLYPLPVLEHLPPREPLSPLLDRFDGINEGWDDLDKGITDEQRKLLEAERAALAAAVPPVVPGAVSPFAGRFLEVPDQEGVLFAEVRDIFHIPLSELHRRRPALRFDPIETRLIRDLGPDLGELCFLVWDGYISLIRLEAQDIPSFEALVARLEPVLAALGGLGPLVKALGVSHPSLARDITPIILDDVRATLVPISVNGRRVYPCWLLGGPPHTKVSLDLSVGLTEGRLSFGYAVSINLPSRSLGANPY